MSKKSELKEEVVVRKEVVEHLPEKLAYFPSNEVSPLPPPQEMLAAQDISALDIARLNRKVALKEAEKALAQNEAAELSFKYIILQLYMKYKLDVIKDGITEDGKIMRGALQQGAKS